MTQPLIKVSRFKKRNGFADRGKAAEAAVQKYLDSWASRSTDREYNRLIDTKAAGRTIKAAAADFEVFAMVNGHSAHGLVEAKETQHAYRLDRDKVPQLPRLRKRAQCGGLCVVLVLHSTEKMWRCATVDFLMAPNDKGSWDLRSLPTFETPGAALQWASTEVFP